MPPIRSTFCVKSLSSPVESTLPVSSRCTLCGSARSTPTGVAQPPRRAPEGPGRPQLRSDQKASARSSFPAGCPWRLTRVPTAELGRLAELDHAFPFASVPFGEHEAHPALHPEQDAPNDGGVVPVPGVEADLRGRGRWRSSALGRAADIVGDRRRGRSGPIPDVMTQGMSPVRKQRTPGSVVPRITRQAAAGDRATPHSLPFRAVSPY